jgi:hypothetical protein
VWDRALGWFTDVSAEGRAFDARWGTRTCWFDFGNYEPTLPSVAEAALDAVDLGPAGATLLDVGSGKGRVVMLASQRPFARVVGLEASPRLHQLASSNLAAFRARGGGRCAVDLWLGDANTHPLPEGPLVVFVYNTLPAHPMRFFLARLRGRVARLVYVNPQQARVVEAAGWSRVAGHLDAADPFWSWAIYRPPALDR